MTAPSCNVPLVGIGGRSARPAAWISRSVLPLSGSPRSGAARGSPERLGPGLSPGNRLPPSRRRCILRPRRRTRRSASRCRDVLDGRRACAIRIELDGMVSGIDGETERRRRGRRALALTRVHGGAARPARSRGIKRRAIAGGTDGHAPGQRREQETSDGRLGEHSGGMRIPGASGIEAEPRRPPRPTAVTDVTDRAGDRGDAHLRRAYRAPPYLPVSSALAD